MPTKVSAFYIFVIIHTCCYIVLPEACTPCGYCVTASRYNTWRHSVTPYKKATGGQGVLDSTIHLAIATWEGEKYSLSGSMLKGLARILVTYGGSINEDTFVEKLSKIPVKQIVRTAKERHPGQLGYSEALMLAYNNKNKHRLSMRALYGKKSAAYESEEEFE